MRSRSHGPALAAEYLDALKHQRRLAAATLGNYSHAIELLLKLQGEQELKSLEPAQVRALGRLFELCSDEIELEHLSVADARGKPSRPRLIAQSEDGERDT